MLRSLASRSSIQGLALSKRCFPSTIAKRGIILAAKRCSVHQLNVASYQKSKFNSLELNSSSSFTRSYSHAPPLTKEIITERIIELLESYNKVKSGTEITLDSSFTKDLGLDSFDTVEVIMEIEYEFSIIIPDADADSLKTVGQAVDYISQQADAC